MPKLLHSAARSFLALPCAEDAAPHFALRMLEENALPGFLPLHPCGAGVENELCYEVSGLHSLSEVCREQALRAAELRHLLLHLLHALSRLPAYLLSSDGVLLQSDCVYLESLGRAPRFLYHPGQQRPFSETLSAFLQELLSLTDQSDEASVVLAYRLYQESLRHPHALDYLERILSASEAAPQKEEPLAPVNDTLVSEIREVRTEELPQKKSGGLLRRLFSHKEEAEPAAEDAVFLEALRAL